MKEKVDQKVFRAIVGESFGIKLAAGMNEGTNNLGGYAVGTEAVAEIIDNIFIDPDYTGLVSRYEIETGKNKIQIPYNVDPLQTDSTVGTRAYWTAEAASVTPSTTTLTAATLTLNKITTLVNITNELLYDVSMADEKIKEYSTKAIKRLIASEMLFGTDAIQGVFKTTTATQKSALSPIPTQNELIAAFKKIHPALLDNAKWYVHQDVFAGLFASGYNIINKTAGNLTILGLPVVVNPWLKGPLSNEHVLLGNFNAYALAYKTPAYDKSITLNFLSNQTAFRMTARFAGDVVTANSYTEDQVLKSAFIIPA